MSLFANNLRQLRTSRDISQKELAERLSLTSSVISAYENGIRMPSYDVLFRLASIFHCSCDYLLGYTDTAECPAEQMIDVSDLSKKQVQALQFLIDTFRDA
ncbi:MAG: helix-turn-helix transcriptional regulator [Eubacterium sp.]|nr:helix-turn-helix transcriptional regulator [Eubacterium sp.]